MNNYIIVISGATATGKSDFANKLAQYIGGEIINADIGSWYQPLTIGTAKPDWKNESVAHHLFDIFFEPQQFDVVSFRKSVLQLSKEIWARGNIPIVVGGSAFYIKSLWYRQYAYDVHDCVLMKKIDKELYDSSCSTQSLWQKLFDVDHVRAQKLHPHDRYRIVRALAIYQATKKKPSEFEPTFDPVAPIFGIMCYRDRIDLYERINQRVVMMLQRGWIQEVKNIYGSDWHKFLLQKKIIGYDDILHYLDSATSSYEYDSLVNIIQQKTRNYAKRQITFLNKLKKDISLDTHKHDLMGHIEEINLTLCDVGLYIKGLLDRLIIFT